MRPSPRTASLASASGQPYPSRNLGDQGLAVAVAQSAASELQHSVADEKSLVVTRSTHEHVSSSHEKGRSPIGSQDAIGRRGRADS